MQVAFPDGLGWYPLDQLEEIRAGQEDAFDLLRNGKLGGPADLQRVLAHARISGGLTDLLYSMEATNTEFHAFQYKPVLKILDSPSNSLLIADEVGLGKTIEAGLIWTELRSRLDFQRLIVVCPAVLRPKWQRELRNRFGVEARIVDARELTEVVREARNNTGMEFALVASMQGLRPSRGSSASQNLFELLKTLEYEAPVFDLLVIDEAHYLRNPKSKTHRLGRAIVDVSDHRVFLSATPIHLGSEDLFQLLHLLDETTFHDPYLFDTILSANAPLVKARDAILKVPPDVAEFDQHLRAAVKHPLLAESQQLAHLISTLGSVDIQDRAELSNLAFKIGEANLLSRVVSRTRKRDVTEWRVLREPVSELVSMGPIEEQAYRAVTESVRMYVGSQPAAEALLTVMPQRQLSSSMAAAVLDWERRRESLIELADEPTEDGEAVDWSSFEEREDVPGPLTRHILERVHQLGTSGELRAGDSKYRRLSEMLTAYLTDHPKEKVVIFAYFRPTLFYLNDRLLEDGFRPQVLAGGAGFDKETILGEFAQQSGPNILLASEVASEGVDLQFARVVVNYDLPWNPMKIEQRIGRIDRIGQQAEAISIWNLAYKGTIDERILSRLYNRLDIFRFALGDLEAVLGDDLRQMTLDLLSGRLTPEQETGRIDQTAAAIEQKRIHEEELEGRASHLLALGDYVLQKIHDARDNQQWLSGEDIAVYVMRFLRANYPGTTFKQSPGSNTTYEINLSDQAKNDLQEFIRTDNRRARTAMVRVDSRPVLSVFTNAVTLNTHGAEIVNNLHPLVRMIGRALDRAPMGLHPCAAVRVGREYISSLRQGRYVYLVQRWNVGGLRDHRRMVYEAQELGGDILDQDTAESLVRAAAVRGAVWNNPDEMVDLKEVEAIAFECLKMRADERFRSYVDDVGRKNADLANLQVQTWNQYRELHMNRLSEVRLGHLQRLENASLTEQGRYRGLLAATEKRIAQLQGQCDRALMKVNERREPSYDSREIAVGIIEVS